jgi:hypothetical protein
MTLSRQIAVIADEFRNSQSSITNDAVKVIAAGSSLLTADCSSSGSNSVALLSAKWDQHKIPCVIYKPSASRVVLIAIIDVLATGTARKRPDIVRENLRRIRTSLLPLSKDSDPKPIATDTPASPHTHPTRYRSRTVRHCD